MEPSKSQLSGKKAYPTVKAKTKVSPKKKDANKKWASTENREVKSPVTGRTVKLYPSKADKNVADFKDPHPDSAVTFTYGKSMGQTQKIIQNRRGYGNI